MANSRFRKGSPRIKPHEVTPEEVARYGHIAATLRLYLKTFDMKVSDFARAFYNGSTNIYGWFNGYQAPPVVHQQRLADFMGVSVKYTTPRELNDPPPPALPNPKGFRPPPPSTSMVTTEPQRSELVVHEREPWAPAAPEVMKRYRDPAKPNPWSYTAHADGTSTITVNVTLPNEHAKPLVRLLMDSGIDEIVTKQQGDDDEP